MSKFKFLLIVIFLFTSQSFASEVILYDASLDTQLPNEQTSYFALFGSGTQSYMTDGSDEFTRYNTLPDTSTIFGYNTTQFLLDRSLGYTFSFTMRVVSETNVNDNRSCFNIVLYSTDEWGIMFYFQPDEIMTSQADFGGYPKAESTTYNTTSFVDYDIVVLGDIYTLYANGSQILTGDLKNYVADLVSKGYSTAYPRLRIGDATSGASGIADISFMQLSGDGVTLPVEPTPIPEPLSVGLVLLSVGGLVLRRAKK